MNATDITETLPSVLTVRESMAALRASKSKLYRLIRTRELSAVKVGRRLLIPRAALVALLTPKEPA